MSDYRTYTKPLATVQFNKVKALYENFILVGVNPTTNKLELSYNAGPGLIMQAFNMIQDFYIATMDDLTPEERDKLDTALAAIEEMVRKEQEQQRLIDKETEDEQD